MPPICNPLLYKYYRDLRVRDLTPRNSRLSYACEGSLQRRKRSLRGANRDRALRLGLVRKGDGRHVHHVNGDPFDNRPSNLRVVRASAHRRLHRKRRQG